MDNTTENKVKLHSQNNAEKYHPLWMVVVLALSIVIATLIWMPDARIGTIYNNKMDRLPSLSPTSTKIILVEAVQNNIYFGSIEISS